MKPKDLRDEFALAALPEVLRYSAEISYTSSSSPVTYATEDGKPLTFQEAVAHRVGKIADAMMAEREKG